LHRASARFSQRAAAREAIERLQLTPVLFELGARPHPPRALRAHLEHSHVFVGLYSQRYGWVGPGETLSGLEAEYAGVPVRVVPATLRYVAAQCRFTDEQQATILDHFIGAADRTAGGVLQATSSAAQVQENADVAYEMERLAVRSRRLRAGAAP
jgi:hypothetical protein